MKNEIITDIFLKQNGKKRVCGRADTMNVLMPHIIMNVALQLYYQKISKVSCSFNLKKVSRDWGKAYTKFNHSMLCYYNEEQKEFIFNKMDDFEMFIYNDVLKTKEVVEEGLAKNKVPFDKRDVLSTCLICNVLAQSAQILWGDTYLTDKGHGEVNMDLQKIEKATMKFAEMYYVPMVDIDLNKFDEVTEAIGDLCHSMIGWIVDDVEKEKAKKPSILGWASWKHRHPDFPLEKFPNGGISVEKTLESAGFEMVHSLSGNLYEDKKAKALAEEIVDEKEYEVQDYEYIYHSKKSKKVGVPDTMTIYRKRKTEAL